MSTYYRVAANVCLRICHKHGVTGKPDKWNNLNFKFLYIIYWHLCAMCKIFLFFITRNKNFKSDVPTFFLKNSKSTICESGF